jgi:hypothetical protein
VGSTSQRREPLAKKTVKAVGPKNGGMACRFGQKCCPVSSISAWSYAMDTPKAESRRGAHVGYHLQ